MQSTTATTIRLDDKERAEAKKKMKAYGLPTLSAVVRFALKKLPMPK